MRRVVSLYLPTWPSDRIRRRDKAAPPRDKPLVTVVTAGGARVVASACRAAQALSLLVWWKHSPRSYSNRGRAAEGGFC